METIDPLHSATLRQELPGLRDAFDEKVMLKYLRQALFGDASPAYTLDQCVLDQSTYLPGECCILRYELSVDDHVSGLIRESVVMARVFPDQSAADDYHEKLAPFAALVGDRDEFAPFTSPIASIQPLHMVVYAFPIDAELPTLLAATDQQAVTDLLGEALPDALDGRFAVTGVGVEVVDYGRQHRCTLRYTADGYDPATGAPVRQVVYGKLTADGTGALADPVSAALRTRIERPEASYQFRVPRSFAWRTDLQLSLLEAIPGAALVAPSLTARLRGGPPPADSLGLEAMIDVCAQVAATLHTSEISIGLERTLDDELAWLRRWVAVIAPISPDLASELGGWVERLAAAASAPLPLVFSHGDFTHSQLLFDRVAGGLVDFDSFCQAEPALDIGQFLAYLRIASLKAPDATSAATVGIVNEELGERFLATYITASGTRPEDAAQLAARISIYKNISLLRRALRSWQKFKISRVERALSVLRQEMTSLP